MIYAKQVGLRIGATKGGRQQRRILIEKIARVHAWKNVNGTLTSRVSDDDNEQHPHIPHRPHKQRIRRPPSLLLRPLTLLINKQQHCLHRYFHYKAIRLHNAGSAGLVLTRKWPQPLGWVQPPRISSRFTKQRERPTPCGGQEWTFHSREGCFNFFRKGTPRGGTKIKRRRNLEREGDVRLASVGLRVEKGRGLRVGGATNHLALCSY